MQPSATKGLLSNRALLIVNAVVLFIDRYSKAFLVVVHVVVIIVVIVFGAWLAPNCVISFSNLATPEEILKVYSGVGKTFRVKVRYNMLYTY